ncbi:MAG TPA: fatty acid desaturase, partial [Phormidium sp.]
MIQLEHAPLQQAKLPRIQRSENPIIGLVIAFTIIGIWASSLVFLISLDWSQIPTVWRIPAIIWQMFLYTGLFITAHDAMHGVIFPQNRKINNLIGSFVLLLYGFFSFDELLKKHGVHHQHPASEFDPD